MPWDGTSGPVLLVLIEWCRLGEAAGGAWMAGAVPCMWLEAGLGLGGVGQDSCRAGQHSVAAQQHSVKLVVHVTKAWGHTDAAPMWFGNV